MLDNIYVIADGAERACIKINYIGHEISIAAEAIGNMKILSRTSIRVYRGDEDVTSELEIETDYPVLETLMHIKKKIDNGLVSSNDKYKFLSDPEVIVSPFDFNIKCGDVWCINTIHRQPMDISKISINSVDKVNDKYTEINGETRYISDLFWGEKCVCLNAAKAQEVLAHLKSCFSNDPVWREITKRRK